jgi:hypothetical protein
MGEDRTTSRSPSSPISTGHVPTFWHEATAPVANSGGSIIDTKRPWWAAIRVWTAASERRTTSSRVAPSAGDQGVRFSTTTRNLTRGYGPSTRSAVSRNCPARATRRRTIRPASPNGSTSSWAASPKGTILSPSPTASTSSSSSTASSNELHSLPSTSSEPTGVPDASSTVRDWTRRKRSLRSTTGRDPSTSTSVCMNERSPGSWSQKSLGATTPNCQRIWFLAADAR